MKLVHVWGLRCWNCQLLHKDFAQGTHSCPQNVFKDDELFPQDFRVKCSRFEVTKK